MTATPAAETSEAAHTWTCEFCGGENDDAFTTCPGCTRHRKEITKRS